jgi:hypothetical protein
MNLHYSTQVRQFVMSGLLAVFLLNDIYANSYL